MDYNDIPVFVRVVETNSFTRAADSLGVQKSSVSRSIARLESELGVRLLQRTTRQLGLTDAGQSFYERVRGALHGFDEASALVRELGGEPRGLIRLTAMPGSGSFGLPEAVASFTRQYPAITVEVELTSRVVDLVREGFDLAVRAGRLADSTLIARKLETSPFALFAAPAYFKRRARPRSAADLAEHECVLFRGRSGRASWTLLHDDAEEVVEVHGTVSSDETDFALRAAVAGAGITPLAPQLAKDAVLRGELEQVLPGFHLRGSELHVVLPSATFVPARVTLLRDHLVREIAATTKAAQLECTRHGHGRAPAAGRRKR
ncbi:MAG TPA: LysR family transcriptional regulator [Polyangiales bacterium]|nr:LysR family transcriptional regulator [Polyangiales bacterium]